MLGVIIIRKCMLHLLINYLFGVTERCVRYTRPAENEYNVARNSK